MYRVVQDARIEILSYRDGTVSPENWPSPDYPLFFAGAPAELVPLTTEQQWVIQKINHFYEEYAGADYWRTPSQDAHDAYQQFCRQYADLLTETHQIGGEPSLVNPWYPSTCPLCEREMPFLALVEDDTLTGERITCACCQMVYYYCRHCHVVCSYVLAM